MSRLLGTPGGSNQPVCVLIFFPHLIFLSFCLALAIAESNIIRCLHAHSCPTLCDLTAHQAPLSMKFSRPEYWNGLPFPTRDQTLISCVSCIGRQILYHWATWQAPKYATDEHNIHIKGPEKESPPIRQYIFVVEDWEAMILIQNCWNLIFEC